VGQLNEHAQLFHRSVSFRRKRAGGKKSTLKTIINALDNALETNIALCVCEKTLATP